MVRSQYVLMLAVATTVFIVASAAVTRLDNPLKPISYDVTIFVDVNNLYNDTIGFRGEVDIRLKCITGEKSKFTMHADGIDFDEDFTLTELTTNQSLPINASREDTAAQTVNVRLSSAGTFALDTEYTLHMKYTGRYHSDLHGLYRSSYMLNNEERWLVATQFEAMTARRAFPCFDEPEYKALFTFHIKIDKPSYYLGYHALTNSKPDGEPQVSGDEVTFNFARTPKKMSTYLVAMVISDFKHSEPHTYTSSSGIKTEITTWSSPAQNGSLMTFSQTVAPDIISFMEEYTGVFYEFNKVDQVALPDFGPGAMENWGLITYKEAYLLIDDERATTQTKQDVLTTIAHELSHQWFGDLVTLHWWSDVWLNEGFACYFGYKAASNVDSYKTDEWDLMSQFVTREIQMKAFKEDARSDAKALQYEPSQTNDVNFNSISYSKGGSMLRMISFIVGETVFSKGLTTYLNDHAEGVGTPETFIQAIQHAYDSTDDASKPPLGVPSLKTAFTNWHQEAGFPVVTVNQTSSTNVTLTQRRFLSSIPPVQTVKDTYWYVPITYTTSESTTTEVEIVNWLTDDGSELELVIEEADWFILNVQQYGYYRVQYEQTNWEALTKALIADRMLLDKISRAQLIDDSFNLAKVIGDEANLVGYEIPFNLTKYLKQETDYVPWSAALNELEFIGTRLASNRPIYDRFKIYVLDLLQERYKQLTFDSKANDTHTDKLNRGLIMKWACQLEYDDCIKEANSKFEQALADHSRIDPDVREVIFCSAIRQGDESNWYKVWDRYVADKNRVWLTALGCSKHRNVLINYLGLTLQDDNEIRMQERAMVFEAVYNGNPENVDIALDYLSNSLLTFNQFYGSSGLRSVLVGISEKVSTDKQLQTWLSILNTVSTNTDLAAVKSSVLAANTTVTYQLQWDENNIPAIGSWLSDNKPSSSPTTIAASLIMLIINVFVVKML